MTATWQVTDAISVPVAAAIAAVVVLLALIGVAVVVLRRRRRPRAIDSAPSPCGAAAVEDATAPMRRGLARTRSSMLQRLLPLLGRSRLDPADVEALEEVLLGADVGIRTTERLVQ